VCVLRDHYDDERDKTVFHNTTRTDLQDQDQDRYRWSFRSQTRLGALYKSTFYLLT